MVSKRLSLPLPAERFTSRALSLQFLLQAFLLPVDERAVPRILHYGHQLLMPPSPSLEALQQELNFLRGAPTERPPLVQCLPRIFSSLFPLFEEELGRDENVLSYCLEYAKELNRVIAPHSIEQLCQKLFPGGLPELQLHLRNCYAKRGFSPPILDDQFTF